MTLNQLRNSVIDLGFEVALDKEEMLIPALSRALYTIYLDRPRLKTVRLGFPEICGRLIAPVIAHKGGERIECEIEGEAYSFRVSGRGRYTVSYGAITEEGEFESDMAQIKGRVAPPAKITFLGDYSYTVFSLATYLTVGGPESKDIPMWGEERNITLSERYADFLSPHTLPIGSDGKTVRGAKITDGVLYLPSDFLGEATLTYKRAPYVPTGDDMDEVIDLPRDSEELLPLLVASYLWLDDDAAKAEYYMALYRSGISTVRATSSLELGREYTTNGWA